MTTVTIVDTGTGNMFSLTEAFRRAGTTTRITRDPAEVRSAKCIVLPGVASFTAVVRGITRLRRALEGPVKDGIPILGICAGLQVMFDSSEEGPGEGLNWFSGTVQALQAEILPHMGWNTIEARQDSWLTGLTAESMVYYAHSYAAPANSPGVVATSNYGAPFAAAVARENIFGVQFHPEKSGPVGRQILQNFLRQSEALSS
jgi:imidazole glycerol-phosphate synthase subunit HisH